MLINEQVKAETVPNPIAGLPSISTGDLVQLMRIDKTMGTERIAGYINDAYDIINEQIPYLADGYFNMSMACNHTCPWESAPTMISHHHRLAHGLGIFAAALAGTSPPSVGTIGMATMGKLQHPRWIRTYKRAVLNEAGALMADNYADFDNIGQGITRGINDRVKSDFLRRIVQHAIADLTGQSRNRIKLL